MKSDEIKKAYIQFFEGKSHKLEPSSSLIPFEDPSLLFTNAGMVQFKKYWATNALPVSKRIVTCQKCVRAGGKDSDLEKIGQSGRHHTFFEMLGNFSFGDYFKKESIEWAWEFVIDVLRINPDKIWTSYYVEDEETKKIWKHFLPEKRIVALGKNDNFWGPAGDTGPCGPCNELYFDYGEDKSCENPECKPGCNCERYLEFWNLVFPQFDRQSDGSHMDLKRKGVDTGMGLERITRILQKTPSNYETDLFLPLIKKLEEISHKEYSENTRSIFRIIVDHVRAIVFLLSDGVIPENEGRGYVLRRIIRRASFKGKKIDLHKPFLYIFVEPLIRIMSESYPSIKENRDYLEKIMKEEEERFSSILDQSQKVFTQSIKSLETNIIPGDMLFKWYDTHGIPKDLIEEISTDKGFFPDWQGFETFMQEQKTKSRDGSRLKEQIETIFAPKLLKETIFVGYNETEVTTKILAFYYLPKRKMWRLVLEKTPFYPEKGGQIGDKGEISGSNWIFKVSDASINPHGIIFHTGEFSKGDSSEVEKDQNAIAKVSLEFRLSVAANHTGTHLLHYCLREFLGKEIKQSGSYVGPEKLRFDFFYPGQIEPGILKKIEDLANSIILQNINITVEETDFKNAIQQGVIAYFLEKYGEKVRIVDIGGFHKELCGGTHLNNTSQIGFFKIVSFASIGDNVKRIEAVTRKEAYNWIKEKIKILEDVSHQLEINSEHLVDHIEKLKKQIKEKEETLHIFTNKFIAGETEKLFSEARIIKAADKEICFIAGRIDGFQSDILGRISDELYKKSENTVVILAGLFKDGTVIVSKVSKTISKILPAPDLLKPLFVKIEGAGGGKEQFAQGVGKKTENIDSLFSLAEKHILELLNKNKT